jgi:hypothetical protein
MRAGARVSVVARTADGEPQPGLRVTLEAKGDPPPLTALAGAVARWRSRAALTAADGKLAFAALWDGTYVLGGALLGERATKEVVQVRQPGKEWQRRLELNVTSDQVVEAEARVVPAARVVLELGCDGAGTLPPTSDVRIVPSFDVESRPASSEQAARLADIARDDVALRGDRRDTLTVGPIEEGDWHVAVRPYGFARWTWAPGTESFEDAMLVPFEVGETTTLPQLAIECAPLLRLVPQVPDGVPLPDMRKALVEATWIPADLQRRHEGAGGKLDVSRREEVVELRGAGTGKAALRVSVTHPHFLPATPIEIEREVDLRDGSLLVLPLAIDDVGGSIEVLAPDGIVRATSTDGTEAVAPVTAGVARVTNLRAGDWILALCADESCAKVLVQWTANVERASQVLLRATMDER